MALLLNLPDEILLMILYHLYTLDNDFIQHGDKIDVLSTRLVCRRLGKIGESIAFKQIKFLEDDEGFRRLFQLARSPLCKLVRVFSCYFEVYRTEVSSSLTSSSGLDINMLSEKQEMPGKHKREHRFQNLLRLVDEGITDLADILSRFENLRAIKIWQNWACSWFWGLEYNEAEALARHPIGYRFFENVMHALATRRTSINDLILGSDRAFCPEWPINMLPNLTLKTLSLYRHAFGNIKRLKVVLPRLAYNGAGEYGLNTHSLRALLELSSLLEDLYLSIDMRFSEEPFEPNFTIPMLRHLVLESLLFRDPSVLLTFLRRHAATLRSVEFHRLSLLNGSLETVVRQCFIKPLVKD